MSREKKLINNTIINSVATVFISVLQFFLVPILVNNLGTVEFGLVGIVNIFSMIGYISFFDFGMASSIQRYAAFYNARDLKRKLNQLINTSLLVFVTIGITLTIIILILADFLVHELFTVDETYSDRLIFAISLFSISYVYQFPLLAMQSVLEGLLNFKVVKLTLALIELSKFVLVLILMKMGYTFEFVIAVYMFLPLISFLFFFYKVLQYFENYRFFDFSTSVLKEVWSFSKYQFIGKSSSLIYNQSDRLLIGSFLGPGVMTSFDVLNKLPAMVNRFLGLAVSAIIPIASTVDVGEEPDVPKKLYHRGFRVYFAFICPIITSCFVYSKDFLTFWVGEEFSYLTNLLQLLLIWCLLSSFTFGGNILMGLNKGMKELTVFRISQSIFKILSLIVLISSLGLTAIPYSFLISVIPIVYLIYVFYKYLKFNVKLFLKDVIGITVISIAVQIPYYFVSELIEVDSIILLGLVLALITITQWILIFNFVFTLEDKALVKTYLEKLLKKV